MIGTVIVTVIVIVKVTVIGIATVLVIVILGGADLRISGPSYKRTFVY